MQYCSKNLSCFLNRLKPDKHPKGNGGTGGDFEFDDMTGNFIVNINMSPEQYGRFAKQYTVADLDSLEFDKTSGQFAVPVFISPDEYIDYAKHRIIPSRYMYKVIIILTATCIKKNLFLLL